MYAVAKVYLKFFTLKFSLKLLKIGNYTTRFNHQYQIFPVLSCTLHYAARGGLRKSLTGDGHLIKLQRLAHYLEYATLEFGQFVQTENTVCDKEISPGWGYAQPPTRETSVMIYFEGGIHSKIKYYFVSFQYNI